MRDSKEKFFFLYLFDFLCSLLLRTIISIIHSPPLLLSLSQPACIGLVPQILIIIFGSSQHQAVDIPESSLGEVSITRSEVTDDEDIGGNKDAVGGRGWQTLRRNLAELERRLAIWKEAVHEGDEAAIGGSEVGGMRRDQPQRRQRSGQVAPAAAD